MHGPINIRVRFVICCVSVVNTYRPIFHLLVLNTYSEEVTGEKTYTPRGSAMLLSYESHDTRKAVKRNTFVLLKERDCSKDLDVDVDIKLLQQMLQK